MKDLPIVEDTSVISDDGLVRVDLDWDCGEGIDGDYRGPNTDDIPLLRFSVFRKDGENWWEVDNASYCTQIPADIPHKEVRRLAEYILNEVEEEVTNDNSVKKLCERLSWINPSWGTKKEDKGWTLDAEQARRKKK